MQSLYDVSDLFSWKDKSNIISLSSAEFSHSMVQSGFNHLTRRNLIMLPPLDAFIFNDRFICHSLLAYALHPAFTTTEICVRSKCSLIYMNKAINIFIVPSRRHSDFSLILQRKTRLSISYDFAGLGGSIGCAVRLETRRSRVQPLPRPATFFCGD